MVSEVNHTRLTKLLTSICLKGGFMFKKLAHANPKALDNFLNSFKKRLSSRGNVR